MDPSSDMKGTGVESRQPDGIGSLEEDVFRGDRVESGAFSPSSSLVLGQLWDSKGTF